MNDDHLLLIIEMDAEFLMLSKLNQPFKVEVKLEAIFLTVVGWYMIIPCSSVLFTLCF